MNCATWVLGLVTITALSFTPTTEANLVDAKNKMAWALGCLKGPLYSGFDIYKTWDYELWFNETSIMQLAQTGTFVGPDDISEYVNFIRAPYFDFYDSTGVWDYKFVKFGQDECVMLAAGTNKAQVRSSLGNPACLQTTVAFKVHWTVADLDGNGFIVNKINIFYSNHFLQKLFTSALNADRIADFICDDVLMAKCPGTVALNNLTSESCKERYDELPETNEGGYLDDNTKGCRVLHSSYAKSNNKHCPHLSFVPEADYKNRTKCQKSAGVLPEDLFSEDELAFIGNVAVFSGYDRLSKYKECEYDNGDELSSFTANLLKFIDNAANLMRGVTFAFRMLQYFFFSN